MSAREELVSTLTDLWLDRCGSQIERDSCRPDAEQLADAYAHELAEKQRADALLIEDEDDCCRKYGLALARSIDPEVLNSE